MWRKLILAVALSGLAAALTPQQLVVVYNADSPLSTRSAKEYARLRQVPREQLVALQGLPKGGDLSRSDFERLVVSPLLYAARCNSWSWPAQGRAGVGVRRMGALVLMPDVPLRVKESAAVTDKRRRQAEEQKRRGEKVHVEWTPDEAASVDSELMLLGAHYPLHSGLNNPCYGKKSDPGAPETPVMAVTRIDGPDEACIRRMIQDPVRVEREGLWGWVVVDKGGPYAQGEKMFNVAAEAAQEAQQPLFFETSGKRLAAAYPLSAQTAVYFGWYTHRADGPFAPGSSFRFAPGAVAGHLHSFSCSDLHDPGQWAPALLRSGASVTFGNVNEPFLAGCHNFGLFYKSLLTGATVAEAQLAALPLLSWQNVVFGDPLYRPFSAVGRSLADNPFARWRELMRDCKGRPDLLESVVRKRVAKPEGATLCEAFAWYCAEHKRLRLAAEFFRMAAAASTKHSDKIRNVLLQITVLAQDGEKEQARELMRRCLEENSGSPHRPAIEATAECIIPEEMPRR